MCRCREYYPTDIKRCAECDHVEEDHVDTDENGDNDAFYSDTGAVYGESVYDDEYYGNQLLVYELNSRGVQSEKRSEEKKNFYWVFTTGLFVSCGLMTLFPIGMLILRPSDWISPIMALLLGIFGCILCWVLFLFEIIVGRDYRNRRYRDTVIELDGEFQEVRIIVEGNGTRSFMFEGSRFEAKEFEGKKVSKGEVIANAIYVVELVRMDSGLPVMYTRSAKKAANYAETLTSALRKLSTTCDQ